MAFYICVLAFGGELIALYLAPYTSPSIGLGMLVLSPTTVIFKAVVAISSIWVLLFQYSLRLHRQAEWYMMFLAVVLGANLMMMARNGLMMLLAMELVGVAAYLMAVWEKERAASAEAGLKYVLFGSFSTAMMIYGLSWIYAATGSLQLDAANLQLLRQLAPATQALIALLFFVGFMFKSGIVPFHLWVADIYDKVDYPTAAFFSVVPKVAGFVLWWEVLRVWAIEEGYLILMLGLLAVASMTWGNVSALAQPTAKRLLAFSGVAQSGFMLMALLPMSQISQQAFLFYLLIYALMNLLAFMVLGHLSVYLGDDKLNAFKGTFQHFPLAGVALVVAMAALVGLPPTAGFVAKWYAFIGMWDRWQHDASVLWFLLMTAAVLNTVISLYYYLKIPAFMIFSPPTDTRSFRHSPLYPFMLVALTIPLLLFGFWGFDRLFGWLL